MRKKNQNSLLVGVDSEKTDPCYLLYFGVRFLFGNNFFSHPVVLTLISALTRGHLYRKMTILIDGSSSQAYNSGIKMDKILIMDTGDTK
jgi:hypothetical protein